MTYGVSPYGSNNSPLGLVPKFRYNSGSLVPPLVKQYIYTDGTGNGAGTYGSNIYANDPVVANPAIAQMGTIAVYQPNYQANGGGPATFPGSGIVPLIGSFQGCRYTPPGSQQPIYQEYWIANTPIKPNTLIEAEISMGDDIVYSIQVSTNINANANLFTALPFFPDTNGTYAAGNNSFWGNYALMIGGGTNFNTVIDPYGNPYNNNPTTGSIYTGSAFYLDVSTSFTNAGDNQDYSKLVATLPLKAIGYDGNGTNNSTGNMVPSNYTNPYTAALYTIATTPFINVLVMINNQVTKTGTAGVTLA